MRFKMHATHTVKRTRYEAVEEMERPNKFWVVKIAQSGKVNFLQPARTLEQAIKFLNKTIEGL